MMHEKAPGRYLEFLSPLSPLPSQLRYLQYVARRNMSPERPPPECTLSLDCLVLRGIPCFDSQKGCRPIIRIFGRNINSTGGLPTQMLYSMQKKTLRHYHQADCYLIKIAIQCLIQGDVVLECVHLDTEPEREVMMFRIMFNTAFIQSNELIFNSDDLDLLWDSKDRDPTNFRAEMLFGEVESISPPKASTNILNGSIPSATSVQGAIHPPPAPRSQSAKSASAASTTPPPQPPSHIGNSAGSALRPFTPPPPVAYRTAARPFPSPRLPPPPAPLIHTTTYAPTPPPPPLPPGPERTASIASSPSSVPKPSVAPPQSKGLDAMPPAAASVGRGRTSSAASFGTGRGSLGITNCPKKNSLKQLHWVKATRRVQGSVCADSQKQDNQSRPLESFFSPTDNSYGHSNNGMNAVLALDSAALYIDQVEDLIKFCPTKDEMEKLKSYTGEKTKLGKCEQFFMELMKVPRLESKLQVFAFNITFPGQVNDLRRNLNTINAAVREVKESIKLRQVMQTILNLENVLNQGTARGSAVGFKLSSLLKLSDTHARNNKMILMRYLCKVLVLSDEMSELEDLDTDLVHLEAASKIELKLLAEEMQAVCKGLEKVKQELAASVNDSVVSEGFQKALKEFLNIGEADVKSLTLFYSEVGRNAESLIHYFGENPVRFGFEQVTQTLVVFMRMYTESREEYSSSNAYDFKE